MKSVKTEVAWDAMNRMLWLRHLSQHWEVHGVGPTSWAASLPTSSPLLPSILPNKGWPLMIRAPFKLQKLPRWVKVRSSGHLSFHVNSFKHANFSDLRKQKVGRGNLRHPLVQFHHCTEEERTAWEVGEGERLVKTPEALAHCRRMDSGLAGTCSLPRPCTGGWQQ